MAYNGSGVFQRIYSWVNDAAANIKIRADRMDAEMNGFATGLSTCITKDGQTTITANLPLSGYKFTGGGVATASTEYATYGQIMTSKTLPTVGGTADAITISHSIPYTALYSGMEVSWLSGGVNTTAVTLAVDGQSAKAVNRSGGTALAAGDIPNAEQITVRYDGTQFELISVAGKTPFLHTTNTFAKATTFSAATTFSSSATIGTTLSVTGAITGSSTLAIGAITSTGAINGVASLNIAGNSTAAGFITLAEDTDNGTNKVTITAPQSISSDYTLTLPSVTGTIALTSDITNTVVLLGTQTASNSASLAFTSLISATYDEYIFVIQNIIPATDGADFYLRTSTNNGSSYDAAGSDYAYAGSRAVSGSVSNTVSQSSSAGQILIAESLGNATGENCNGKVTLFNPLNATVYKCVKYAMGYYSSAPDARVLDGAGYRLAVADIDAVQFLMSSGNITSGVIRMYGVRKA